jgi:hypothetical protein
MDTVAYKLSLCPSLQSSAQAAQSLLRNILGATFPFFGNVGLLFCCPLLETIPEMPFFTDHV